MKRSYIFRGSIQMYYMLMGTYQICKRFELEVLGTSNLGRSKFQIFQIWNITSLKYSKFRVWI